LDAAAHPRIADSWRSTPNIFFLWPLPIATAAVAAFAWRSLERGGEPPPFLAAIGLFLLGYLGLAISTDPYIVPPVFTVAQAAAAPASQMFPTARDVGASAGSSQLLRPGALAVSGQAARRRGP
jgi:cytochrome bd ubiquinol oxidase subunit II